MEKKDIFKKAHQLAKQNQEPGEKYRTAFSRMLKHVYQLIKSGSTNLLEYENDIKELDKAIEETNDLKNRQYLIDRKTECINRMNQIKFEQIASNY